MRSPLLADVDELIGPCERATDQFLGSHTAEEAERRLEEFRESLKVVRGIPFAIKDWVEQAKRQPVADMPPQGGFGDHH